MAGITELVQGLGAIKSVLDILRAARDLLPLGPDKERAAEKIEQAEKALRESEVNLAKSLGYKLCQCTFPPQIMLRRERDGVFACPNSECGHTRPIKLQLEEPESDWLAARRR